MKTQYATCVAMRSVIVLSIFCCILFGYEDANIWRKDASYTVPAGKYFWLYGVIMRGMTNQNIYLEVNGSEFVEKVGLEPLAYRFSPPLKFSSGTTISRSGFGAVTYYGYEGTSNQSVEEQEDINTNPAQLNHTQVAPVPFSAYTSINYQVPHQDFVLISIYDEAGRVVRTVVDENMAPGNYTARWDGTDSQGRKVAAGSYFCIVKTNGESTTKVVYVK